MGKKSRKETFRAIGVRFEVSSGQNFENLTRGRTSKGPNPGFDQERVFRFGTLRQCCVKFLPRNFYLFWRSHCRKFRFGRFDSGATRWVKFENFNLERVFRFGTLRQWSRKFPFRIFYPFWSPHGQKLRIGLFDRRAIKWCFWLACDQNLGSVVLRYDHGSNFWNFDLERLRTFTPVVPKVSLQDFLPILGAPRPKITNRSFRPSCDQIGAFNRRATKIYVRSFWPLCDQERLQKTAIKKYDLKFWRILRKISEEL